MSEKKLINEPFSPLHISRLQKNSFLRNEDSIYVISIVIIVLLWTEVSQYNAFAISDNIKNGIDYKIIQTGTVLLAF